MMARPAGCGFSTEMAELDFETYSEAGYCFDEVANRWQSIVSSPPHGIGAVGAAVYSEHPSTEILSVAYDLKDDLGPRLWMPGAPLPSDLFEHVTAGRLIEAWNSMFEFLIWKNVCTTRMGWPILPLEQLRDAMAKARAHALPGKLEYAGDAIGSPILKIADGKRLLTKFSKPRNPTKKDLRRRIRPPEDPEDAAKLYRYNVGDIQAEGAISALCPDLSPPELAAWLMDQGINARGVAIDVEGLTNCKEVIRQAMAVGIVDLRRLTGDVATKPTQIQRISGWLESRGVVTPSLDADAVSGLLARTDLALDVRRVLEIRASLGAASVKKLAAMERTMCQDSRVRDLFMYCGAERTGRWAGRGVQPQNLPKSGPTVRRCGCDRHFAENLPLCPWCGRSALESDVAKWGLGAAQDALYVIETQSLPCVEYFFGDAVAAISGCLRGLLCAAPGYELISSDYSAIEAVVLAVLAGEEWRLEVFRTHGMNYEMAASKITGIPFGEFARHREETGEHHPMRGLGKTAELASGYQGWIGAWKKFGADKHFNSDDEIGRAILKWRKANPMIAGVKDRDGNVVVQGIWGGLEAAAKAAIKQPGQYFNYRNIWYGVKDDILYCQLPSGRLLSYHSPRILPDVRYGRPVEKITFMGWNSDYTKGPKCWMRFDTYGGKLTENVTQAASRDVLAHAMPNLEAAGYPIVLHVHDEPVSEVPAGFGSIEEYETIMCQLPPWATDWPIRAGGGWRGRRYRKD